MKKLLLFGLLAITLFAGCDKENGTNLPEPEPTPTPKPDEPQNEPTFLKFSTSIEMMDEVTTKAPVSQFQRDDEIGLFITIHVSIRNSRSTVLRGVGELSLFLLL